jgi:hypothetical protein
MRAVSLIESLELFRNRISTSLSVGRDEETARQAKVLTDEAPDGATDARRSVCHSTSRLAASARLPASLIATQTTVIRRVLVHIVPGWIVASPSRASRSSNAFVKP